MSNALRKYHRAMKKRNKNRRRTSHGGGGFTAARGKTKQMQLEADRGDAIVKRLMGLFRKKKP